MLAVKVFDRDAPGATAAVLAHIRDMPDVGVELANYAWSGFGTDEPALMALSPKRKSLHLDHAAYSLIDLVGLHRDAAMAKFEEEIAFAERLGVGAGTVIHVGNTDDVPVVDIPGTQETVQIRWAHDLDAVVAAVRQAARHIGRVGPLFIENTFEDVGWFHALFARLDAEPLDRRLFGLCLDIGHAKIWGGTPLSEWLDLCADLTAAGRPVHAHVHANDGLKDRHKAFIDAEPLGWLDRDDFCPNGLMTAVRRLADLCGPEHCVLEIGTKRCIANLEWTRAALA